MFGILMIAGDIAQSGARFFLMFHRAIDRSHSIFLPKFSAA